MSAKYDPLVTVCDKCWRACCWQGEFMCENAGGAGIVDRKVSSLIVDGDSFFGEHPDYWNKDLKVGHRRPLLLIGLPVVVVADAGARPAFPALLAPLTELRLFEPEAAPLACNHVLIVAWPRDISADLDKPCHADVLLELANRQEVYS